MCLEWDHRVYYNALYVVALFGIDLAVAMHCFWAHQLMQVAVCTVRGALPRYPTQ